MDEKESIGLLDSDVDVESILSELKGEKIGSLKEAIDDINDLIQKREALTKEIFKDIDKINMGINNFLMSLPTDQNIAERINLKQKQIEIEELKINEKVNSWRDVAALKKELRERVQEFKEKEASGDMIDKLLES